MGTTMPDHPDAVDWREAVAPLLARLEDFELPDVPLDFSASSLDALEAALLDRIPAGQTLRFDARDLTGSATAYVGEVLLRIAGGGWRWDDAEGLPCIALDPALGRSAFSPFAVIRDATTERTGSALHDRADTLSALVARHRAEHPGWSPTKELTPAVDHVARREPEPGSLLAVWVDEGRRIFERDAAADPRWDFGVESLDALEDEVRRRVPSVEALASAEHADLVHWAHWYGGEVVRRAGGGVWAHRVEDPRRPSGMPDLWAGRPFVADVGPRKQSESPYVVFRVAVRTGREGVVRERLEGLLQ